MICLLTHAVLVLSGLAAVSSRDDGLARTPPMGWMSWEVFRCNVDCRAQPDACLSERLIRQQADRMAGDGYLEAGYQYVIVDDCWMAKERSPEGRLQPDPHRFPSGIKALSDYVHSRGLKMGIYGDIGTHTCGGYPGMAGHFELDAQTYADWDIDYLKVDGCYADVNAYSRTYPDMGRALNATGRPIVFSCSWPAYLPDPVETCFEVPYAELQEHCHLWRNWGDIESEWGSVMAITRHWAQASQQDKEFTAVARPGAWNDPDMLVIGNEALTRDQAELQMGAWALFAAPLLMGTDLRAVSEEARAVLLKAGAIAINQDAAGHQGRLVGCQGGCGRGQVWAKALSGGDLAVGLINLGDQALKELCVSWAELHIPPSVPAEVHDVFAGESRGFVTGALCADLRPTAILLARLVLQGTRHHRYWSPDAASSVA